MLWSFSFRLVCILRSIDNTFLVVSNGIVASSVGASIEELNSVVCLR